MDSVTVAQSVMQGVTDTAVEAVNEVSMWSTATSVFVVLFMVALAALVVMAIVLKNKNVLMDSVVSQMDINAGNPTHNATKRVDYVGSLANNKWFAKRYLK